MKKLVDEYNQQSAENKRSTVTKDKKKRSLSGPIKYSSSVQKQQQDSSPSVRRRETNKTMISTRHARHFSGTSLYAKAMLSPTNRPSSTR